MYGQTEATARMSYLSWKDSKKKIGSVGKPIPEGKFFLESEDGKIITKASKLGTYGEQYGFYSSLNIDLGSLFDAGLAFQNLKGEQYNAEINDFEEASNLYMKLSAFWKNTKIKNHKKLKRMRVS